jgi:gliding motility-associated-like protein
MRTNLIALLLMAVVSANGQRESLITNMDNTKGVEYWMSLARERHLLPAEAQEFVQSHLNDTIQVFKYSTNTFPTTQQFCTNMDFETGDLSGWVATSGYHPLYNSTGCCPFSGGAQAIMSGAGNDVCGGFPVVCPGGNFSLKLGDNQVGGRADRIEQTFLVTAANAYFTYKYAVVLQDPGHSPANQPKFEIEMFDQQGNPIPCTYYSVTAGQGIPGFFNSTTCTGVIYKPWSSVSVDLTAYIGQNVTIRFTTYDCALGGHYAYAYIDGDCLSFPQTQPDTICVGQTKTLCAPSGFAAYQWSGVGVNGNTNQCVTISNPGNYAVQTTMFTGCPGPTFYFPVFNRPTPNANFNIGNSNTICGLTVNFHNTSSNAGGTTYWYWDFGDGSTSNVQNPVHTYSATGQYSVTLIVGNSYGCYDTTGMMVDVNNPLVANFNAPDVCLGAVTNFTNTSSISQGAITSSQWSFGDGSTSNQMNPSYTYTTAGTYSVMLVVTSNKGCKDTVVKTVNVYSLPNVTFTATNVCYGNSIQFTSNTNVSGGSIVMYQWNFGNGQTSNQIHPTYTYPMAGNYTVSLTVSSNNNCINTYSLPITVYPLPQVNFSASNVCYGTAVTFNNQSSIATGSIVNYLWSFGNGQTSTLVNPQCAYTSPGVYTVHLTAISDNNCSSTISHTVEVYPLPQVLFTAQNNCANASIVFNNQSTVPNGQIIQYQWNLSNGFSSTLAQPQFSFSTPGIYTATLTVISNHNCIAASTNTFEVYPLPNISFSFNNVCEGNPVYFVNNSNISSGNIASYQWQFGNGWVSSQVNPNVLYSSAGNYVVTLTATSDKSCVASASNTVSVFPTPHTQFSVTTACFNHPNQFTNLSTISFGSITKFKWDFENDGVWDDTLNLNPLHVYPSAGIFKAKLLTVSNNGCSNQTMNNVVVHQNPVANFSTNKTCLGDITQFTNLSYSNDGIITAYYWDLNADGYYDNVSNQPTFQYPSHGSYLITLEVQTEHGCISTIKKPVYVNPNPNPIFSIDNPKGCPKHCVSFQNLSTIVSGNIQSYQWNFGDGSISTTFNPVHCYENSGVYSVILKAISDSGCVGSFILPNSIQVYPQPIAGFATQPERVVDEMESIEVTNASQGASVITYTLSDGTIYHTPNFVHTITQENLNQLIIYQSVMNSYGCKDSVFKIFEIIPGFAIYFPNAFTPNDDNLNDGFTGKGYGIKEFKMYVFDRWGHIIYETDDINKPWDGKDKNKNELVPNDTYVWKAIVKDKRSKAHEFVGKVTVVR